MITHLSLSNLFKYLDATPASRCIIEGEAVLNAQHIITCGIKEQSSILVEVFALVLQSSGTTTGLPHETTVTLLKKINILEISKSSCTCKAGLSQRCKHISAVLLHCTR
jgi:hypothetical protein